MATVPRKQRLANIKANPALEILLFMEKMEAQYELFVKNLPAEVTKAVDQQVNEINLKVIQRAVREILKDVKGPKGDPGNDGKPGMPALKPVRGKDYWTVEDQASLTKHVTAALLKEQKAEWRRMAKMGVFTPRNLVTPQMVTDMINGSIGRYFAQNDVVGESNIEELVKMAVQNVMEFEKVARGLEALTGDARLSYKALKDLPTETIKFGAKPGKKGGGGGDSSSGSTIASYDLSDLLDGATKSFAVPANTQFLELKGSQFPFIYRKTTDFTGTGTTTLTLTAEVDAPQAGQTLILLYEE